MSVISFLLRVLEPVQDGVGDKAKGGDRHGIGPRGLHLPVAVHERTYGGPDAGENRKVKYRGIGR